MDHSFLAFEIPNFIMDHIKAIALLSGMTSAMIAMVMFLPRANALAVGDWVRYFGLAFAFIAGQYFLNVVVQATVPGFKERYLYHLIWGFLSNANSVLFLAATIALLGRSNSFPRLIIFLAIGSAILVSFDKYSLEYPFLSWVRLPDGILSAFCLGAVGVTIGSNIGFFWSKAPVQSTAIRGSISRPNFGFFWRKALARSATAAAVLYAVLLIVYGIHPILARYATPQAWFGPSVEKVNRLQAESRSQGKLESLDEIQRTETLKALDALAFVIALLLKMGLFIPAYILLILILKSAEQSDQLLERLGHERLSYLSGPGIVQLMGEQLKADKVELLFLVPGTSRRIASFSSEQGEGDVAVLKRLDDDPSLAKVMRDGRVRRQLARKPSSDPFITEDGQGQASNQLIAKATAVLVPIKYNGAVVGCLRIEQTTSAPFSETAIQLAKSFARLLTLLAQPYRYLATLDQISYRCARLQVEHRIRDSEQAVISLVGIVDRILSPLAAGMSLDIGFKRRRAIVGKRADYKALVRKRWEELDKSKQSAGLKRIPFATGPRDIPLEAYEAPLVTNLSDEANFSLGGESAKRGPELGNFIFIAQASKDEIDQPTLGMFYLHRKAISSVLSDAILDLARDIHSDSLNQFSLAVSLDEVDVQKWFEALEASARAAELLWAVMVSPGTNEEPKSFGDNRNIAIVTNAMTVFEEKIETANQSNEIALIELPEVVNGASSLVFLPLKKTGQLVCFGIERPGFGVELKFDSPWKAFLFTFCDLADSALDRLMKDTKLREIQIEASQNQALATVAATTGTIIHQLVNMTRDQMSASATLRMSLRMGRLTTDNERLRRIIHSMNESGRSMLELTQAITNITKVDDTRPCSLAAAVEHARDLFNISIAQTGIDFDFQIDPNLMIDVPYYVAALALANLVSNSKDALKFYDHLDKRIQVTASESMDKEGKEWIHCHVLDTGPGISEGSQDKVFHLGFSTKPNSGGWGLYLVKRALRENGSNIELVEPGPRNTTFSIQFPKSKRHS